MNETQKRAARIAIAKDVIAGLKSRRYTSTPGDYFDVTIKTDKMISEGKYDLKRLFSVGMKTCKVCAKGALFIAAVEKYDKVMETVDSLDIEGKIVHIGRDNDGVCGLLKDYFDMDQLDLIEFAFEGVGINGRYEERGESPEVSPEEERMADAVSSVSKTYIDRFADPKKRMIAIMQNIIDNKGTFVPSLD
jgi:hypothetical protein